jgi:VRR-NUC domain
MNKPQMTEDRIQQECSMWFKNTYKEHRNKFFMIHNGGTKKKARAALDVSMGITKGVPDSFLSMSRRGYNGLYVEFKTEIGKLSSVQSEVIAEFIKENYFVSVIKNIDDFKKLIWWYFEPLTETKDVQIGNEI